MKLKPCPFCGGEARWVNDDESWIKCSYCGVETMYFDDTQEAIEAWNRREPIDEIVEQLEERKQEEGNVTLTKIAYNTAIEDAIEIVKEGGESNE